MLLLVGSSGAVVFLIDTTDALDTGMASSAREIPGQTKVAIKPGATNSFETTKNYIANRASTLSHSDASDANQRTTF
jgi:hypothetical protein